MLFPFENRDFGGPKWQNFPPAAGSIFYFPEGDRMVPQSRSSAPFIVLGVCFRINLKSTAISPIRPQRQEVFF